MGMRAGTIKCSNCHRMLPDTYHEEIICTYCGKRTNRAEAIATSEEEVRRKQIWDISDKIRKYKVMRNIGFAFGPVLMIVGIVILFSNIFTLLEMSLFTVTLALGVVWLFVGISSNRKKEATINRMYDMSGEAADADF